MRHKLALRNLSALALSWCNGVFVYEFIASDGYDT